MVVTAGLWVAGVAVAGLPVVGGTMGGGGAPSTGAVALSTVGPSGVVGTIEIQGLKDTHPHVVRREILIKPGDPLEWRLLEESRRRIAALPFIRRAEMHTSVVEGTVHITYQVEEQPSWEFIPSSSGGGGNVTVHTRLGDSNFLGRGLEASAEYTYNTFKQHYASLKLADPYFVPDAPLGAHLQGGWGQDGYLVGVALWRSPRWVEEEWTFELGGTFQQDTIRLFHDGAVVGLYTVEYSYLPFRVGRAWVDHASHYHLTMGVRWEQAKFLPGSPAPAVTPANRQRLIFSAMAGVGSDYHVKETWYNGLGEEEEVTLGARSSIGWEHATAGILSDTTFHTIRVSQSQDYRLGGVGYLFLNIGVEGRVEARDLTNLTTSFQGKLAVRTLPFGFFVGRMVIDALLKNEDHRQLLLGSESGLRGYPINRFAGEKRWYFNMEQRTLLYRSDLLNLGGVFFVDLGHVYKESELMDPRFLNTAIGVGLRITSPRFGFPMARLDVGYGVLDRLFAVSFGTHQYF